MLPKAKFIAVVILFLTLLWRLRKWYNAYRSVHWSGIRYDWTREERLQIQKRLSAGHLAHMDLKQYVNDTEISIPATVDNTTNAHAPSAHYRRAVREYITNMALNCSYSIYCISPSTNEIALGWDGVRAFYTLKDSTYSFINSKIPSNPLYVMVDVDYYLKPAQYYEIAKSASPIVQYTFMPERPAAVRSDYCYSITPMNTFQVVYDGAQSYEHFLYDWEREVMCFTWIDWYFRFNVVVYQIVRRRVAEDRALVVLVPVVKTSFNFLERCLYFDSQLFYDGIRHRVFVENTEVGQFVRMVGSREDNRHVLLARPGDRVSSTMCLSCENILKNEIRSSPTKVTIEAITSKMCAECKTDPYKPMWCEYLTATCKRYTPMLDLTHSLVTTVRSAAEIESAKPRMRSLLSLPVNDVSCPAKTPSNCVEGVARRVVEVANNLDLNGKQRAYAAEFIEMLVKETGQVEIMSVDVINEHQSKKSQRAKFSSRCAQQFFPSTKNQPVDLKAEPYADFLKAPRVITAQSERDYLDAASVFLPMGKVFKKLKWYAFGYSPAGLEQRVADVAKPATFLNPGDLTNCDGTTGLNARTFQNMLASKIFVPKDVKRALQICKKMYSGKSRITSADKSLSFLYENGYKRNSGFGDTSVGNTAWVTFLCYCALRFMGLTPEQAWKALGIYGGDDSLTPGLTSEAFNYVVKAFGMIPKTKEIARGEHFEFLGRVYGRSTWDGVPCSIYNPERLMVKFPVTTNMNDSPSSVLASKCRSLLTVDPNYPMFAPFAKHVLDLNKDKDIPDADLSYSAKAAIMAGCGYTQMPDDEARGLISKYCDIPALEAFMVKALACDSIEKLLAIGDGGYVRNKQVVVVPSAVVVTGERSEVETKAKEISSTKLNNTNDNKRGTKPAVVKPRRNDKRRGPSPRS